MLSAEPLESEETVRLFPTAQHNSNLQISQTELLTTPAIKSDASVHKRETETKEERT